MPVFQGGIVFYSLSGFLAKRSGADSLPAIGLWDKLGFEVVGRLPKAFNHPEEGYVDALVMYKWL